MRSVATAAALVLASVGCSGANKAGGTAASASNAGTPPAMLQGLERELEATVLESFVQMSLGNLDAYRESIARGREVILIGTGPRDLHYGTRPRSLRSDRRPLTKRAPEVLSKNLDVHLSTEGDVGWVFDEISLRVTVDGRLASIPIRLTAVFVRDVDRWVMVLDHWSYPMRNEDILSRAKHGELSAPRRMSSVAGGAVGKELLAIVGKLHNRDERFRRSVFSAADDALLLQPDPDLELRGGEIARSTSLAEQFGDGTTVGLRDYRVNVSAAGDVAWIAANLVVRRRAEGWSGDIGLRATYVLEKRESGWQVVQMHISAPVSDSQLEELVFGKQPLADLPDAKSAVRTP